MILLEPAVGMVRKPLTMRTKTHGTNSVQNKLPRKFLNDSRGRGVVYQVLCNYRNLITLHKQSQETTDARPIIDRELQ